MVRSEIVVLRPESKIIGVLNMTDSGFRHGIPHHHIANASLMTGGQ